jgi:hypothetical protein
MSLCFKTNNGSGKEASLIFISFTELGLLIVRAVILDKGPGRVLGHLCRCRWGRSIALKFQDAITQRAVSYTRKNLILLNHTDAKTSKLNHYLIFERRLLGTWQKVGLCHRVFLVPGFISWGFSCFHDTQWKTAWKRPGLLSLPTCRIVMLLLIHCIYVKVVHKC